MTSLEDLPDELLESIIKSLDLYLKCHINLDMYYAACSPFRNPCSSHPVNSVSLVNRRLRRLSLPILFRKVSIKTVNNVERFQCLMKALQHNMHLMPLIRELSIRVSSEYIISKEPVTLLLIDVLSRCTGLKRLDLPQTELGHGEQRPIIEALNSHPSDNIRLQFMSVEPGISFNALQSISLSRVICQNWERRRCSDQKMKTLLAQGLSIQSIWLNKFYDDSWMDMTYPGLTKIDSGWIGNERSLQSTIDFLLRHPLLEEIGLDETHKCDMTPWHVALTSKLYPYSFKIVIREVTDSDLWQEGNSVVKIGGEWLYDDVKVVFQDDISHGDVETVETMVRKLSMALPQSPNCPWLRVGIDFSSPVGEYLTSDDLIGILTRNISHNMDTLNLGKFVGDILTRECSPIHEPGSTVQDPEYPILAFKSFCKRLNQPLPKLRVIQGQTARGEWMSR
ncbi:hypothetical protein K435DRAFT_868983 [Dendrothele bispora CBS 962.96]|uniref:Uncharacterized protein n=1 Tax=Dendrothele bispora (strain CBS 962.96) TaxID=1314807 RepID=A0A4S8LAB5_DENBC|nr:hypothetical protein K435DRAFT_868983 [Dendrothele bispora CBS 962.96]